MSNLDLTQYISSWEMWLKVIRLQNYNKINIVMLKKKQFGCEIYCCRGFWVSWIFVKIWEIRGLWSIGFFGKCDFSSRSRPVSFWSLVPRVVIRACQPTSVHALFGHWISLKSHFTAPRDIQDRARPLHEAKGISWIVMIKNKKTPGIRDRLRDNSCT